MEEQYDVVIIGGGPAGAAAAITLCKHTKFKVALIERAVFDDYRAGESVSPSIFPLLAYLGLSREQLECTHLAAYAHAAAWGSEDLVVRDLLFTGHGNGLHLDRQKFDSLLLSETQNCGTTIFQPAQIIEIEKNENWDLKLKVAEKDTNLSARYLIDCSGKNALIVKKQECKVHKEDSLIALYAYYETNELAVPHQTILETTEDGWYYLTPLPGKKLAVAFFTDADILKTLNINESVNWLKNGMKTVHISKMLVNLKEPEILKHYAIYSRVAQLPGIANWTAAGDAASSFDPISALGIGHAINSGINSARVAEAFFTGNRAVGTAYSRALLDHFGTYLQMRKGFYVAEQRWQNKTFWKRRMAV